NRSSGAILGKKATRATPEWLVTGAAGGWGHPPPRPLRDPPPRAGEGDRPKDGGGGAIRPFSRRLSASPGKKAIKKAPLGTCLRAPDFARGFTQSAQRAPLLR